MKTIKRSISLILVMLLAVSVFSVITVSAEDEPEYDHPGGYECLPPYEPGDNIVYLKPPEELACRWYAWTYSGDEGGELIEGVWQGNGVYSFERISDYVQFICADDMDLKEVYARTSGESTSNGLMYEIAYSTDELDGMGNEYKLCTGAWMVLPEGFGYKDAVLQPCFDIGDNSWFAYTWENNKNYGQWVAGRLKDDGLVYFKNLYENVCFVNNSSYPGYYYDAAPEGTTGDLEIIRDYFIIENTEKTSDSYGRAYDLYTGRWSSAPVNIPQPDASEATEPEETTAPVTSEEKGVKVTASLNGNAMKMINAEKSVTVSYDLTAQAPIEDGQGVLTYDSDVLELKSFKLPNIPSTVTSKKSGKVNFNFSGIDAETKSGVFDFKNGGIFVTAEFEVKPEAAGNTDVNLLIDILDGLEDGKEVSYYMDGIVSAQEKENVTSDVKLSADTGNSEEETVPEKGVKVTGSINGENSGEICAEKSVTVSYYLTAPMLLESSQGILTYDSGKLELQSFDLPSIPGKVINTKDANKIYYNFTCINAETKSGSFDFKNGGVFVTATFNVIPGASGNTKVNLVIDELDGYEEGEEVSFFTNGAISAQEKERIITSVKFSADTENITAATDIFEENTEQAQPETRDPESLYEPTEEGSAAAEITEETTISDEDVTEPFTVAPTEAPTQAAPKTAQKISAKDYVKINGSKSFKINAKASGGGKLSYSSGNRKVAQVSSDGKVSLKGCGKAVITITAPATSSYLKAVKKITVTVKPAKVNITASSSKNNKIVFKFNKQNGLSAYEVQYADNSGFKKKKAITVSGSKTSIKISGVSSGKTYYVKIRAKAKIIGKTYASDWTKRKVKVK